jgi:hypothetical protein
LKSADNYGRMGFIEEIGKATEIANATYGPIISRTEVTHITDNTPQSEISILMYGTILRKRNAGVFSCLFFQHF